jgi:hypothetical protein
MARRPPSQGGCAACAATDRGFDSGTPVNLMLAVLVVSVGAGLLLPRFERSAYLMMGILATLMTALYFFSTRFM